MFDLAEYFRRIGYMGSRRPDLDTLAGIHRAHIGAIPFENLDIQIGRGVSLDPEALQAKIVRQRRGGYCFEQNSVLAMALAAIGFAFTTCEARVRMGAGGAIRSRTHMVLTVPVGDRRWLADVGFGGDGLVEPIAMDGTSHDQAGFSYRVVAEGHLAVLQRSTSSGWEDLYAVLPEPIHPVDLEVANWYTSTFPRGAFVQNLTAQRIVGQERHILRNLTYSITRGDAREERQIARADVVRLLRGTFGIDVADDQRFLALDASVDR